ncbi:major facilitator superfamily domain-containing protein [Aspergillus insuetus]
MVLAFFVTYVVFNPLATAMIRHIGPRISISALVVSWGACLIGFAYSPNWQTLTGLRALLAVLEAEFFPGCVYLLSCWYSRYEIVIMQGVLSFIIGILCMVFVVDFPDKGHHTWGFLNERECALILRRLNRDRADADPEPFHFLRFLRPAIDLKLWGFALIFFCLTTVTYAIAYFLPIILHENMGFSVAASQCLVAPPFALAGILMVTTAWLGDKYRMRALILILNSIITLIRLPIMRFADTSGVRFFGMFLTTAGANANIPACMAYQANNIWGQWTRVFASATMVGFGGICGIGWKLDIPFTGCPRLYLWDLGGQSSYWESFRCQLLLLIVIRGADRGEKIIEGSPLVRYTI